MSIIEKIYRNIENIENKIEFNKKEGNMRKVRYYTEALGKEKRELETAQQKDLLGSHKELETMVKKLKAELEEFKDTMKKIQEENIKLKLEKDKFLHPEKYETPEPEPQDEMVECPNCHRSVSRKGMKTHQSRWCKG